MFGLNPRPRYFSWVWLVCFLATATVRADSTLDVMAGGEQRADRLLSWCATSVSETVETVSSGGCLLQPLLPGQITPGFDHRAFWLRLNLSNQGPAMVERWITVGHPRLANITLFIPEETGWTLRNIGNLTPMAERGEVERDFGALPLSIGPNRQLSVWLRVQTDTAVDLSTTVWAPVEFMAKRQANQFWVSLGLGGLLVTILFAIYMLVLTRQWAYGYFALGLSGSLFTICLTAGYLQRFIWPVHWPLPSVFIALANLFGVLGYFGFIRAFLPQRARYPRSYGFLKLAVVMAVAVLLYAIAIDYAPVASFSGGIILLMVIGVVLMAWRAWRDGDRSAGILLVAFSIHGLLLVYRLMFAIGILSWVPEALLIGVWGMILSAPVVLLGLVSRTRQLQAELINAQSENTAQLAFFAHLSHELRSPLDTILGNAQLLARMGQGTAFTSGLSAIFQSGRHLLRMIDHLLDYARGLSGAIRMSPSPVDMEAFLRGIERTGWLFAARSNNQFVMGIDTDSLSPDHRFLQFDSGQLREVLDNLLSNASRHTQQGRIGLNYRVTDQPGRRVRLEFTVWDSGEGIAEEDLQRIFKPFERVGQPGYQSPKGVGLGLAIARHLTELMGGQLTAQSELGQGSRFGFWIMAEVLPSDTQAGDDSLSGLEAVGYEGERRSVLLVDDDDANRNILAGLLNGLGFKVQEAHSGDEADGMLSELSHLDLVITDQFMPHGDGWRVLESVRESHPDVPVFLVSAAPPLPGEDPGRDRFTQHFLRPLNHKILLEAIADRLGLTWTAAESQDRMGAVMLDVRPSQSELEILGCLIETGQVTAIENWAKRIQMLNPECAGYVERVLQALETLDFKALEQLSAINSVKYEDQGEAQR